MICRALFIVLVLVFGAVSTHAQDSCLQITKVPKPEKPVDRIIVADDIGVRVRVEFESDGSLGSINPIAAGLDKKVDALVFEAAKHIEFRPKQIKGKSVTVKRDVDYTYSYTTRDWTISPAVRDCATQSDLLTDDEENLLKATAKQFVSRLTETHDLRPLIADWFIPDFVPFLAPEIDFVPEKLFSKLTDVQKRRIFISFWNYLYLQTVIRQSKPENLECYDESPECEAKGRAASLRVLSPRTVARIEAREKETGENKPVTKDGMFAYLSMLESVFDEALPILKAKKLEQSTEFKYWIKLFEDDWHLNYLIKDGISDKTYRDSKGNVLISKGERIIGVETPLLIRVDFVKRGNSFKAFNLGAGDGD